jgi:hypothetical protein
MFITANHKDYNSTTGTQHQNIQKPKREVRYNHQNHYVH